MSGDSKPVIWSDEPQVSSLSEPTYNSAKFNDSLRKWVTFVLLSLLVCCVLYVGVLSWFQDSLNNAKEFAVLALTPVLSIFSAVTGFYFGQKS